METCFCQNKWERKKKERKELDAVLNIHREVHMSKPASVNYMVDFCVPTSTYLQCVEILFCHSLCLELGCH